MDALRLSHNIAIRLAADLVQERALLADSTYGCSLCHTRLQPLSHGCSLCHTRLQPLSHTVAASVNIRLQEKVLLKDKEKKLVQER